MSAVSGFSRLLSAVTARHPRGLRVGVPKLGELRHVAPSLRADDPCFVEEWRAGTFAVDGTSVTLLGRSPIECRDAPMAWLKGFHGFSWLRHVPYEHDDQLCADARAATRALVKDWIEHRRQLPAIAHSGDVAARRILSWLAHSDLLLEDADRHFYDAVAGQIEADLRVTDAAFSNLGDADRLAALVARVQACLCFTDGAGSRTGAERALRRELERQFAPDGGHISRSPQIMLAALLDLVPLKQLYAAEYIDVPEALGETITKAAAFVGQLRLGDGMMARLGSAPLLHVQDIAPFGSLARFDAHGSTLAPASKFARLEAGETIIVADAGSPATSGSALAFEMSDSVHAVVTSALSSDATAARHSTLVFEDEPPAVRSIRAPSLSSDAMAELMIAGDGTATLDATQAGYSGYGVAHRRTLSLSADGALLVGEDSLRPMAGTPGEASFGYALHFQLDEHVVVTRLADTASVDLTLGNGVAWRFTAPGTRLSLETCLLAGARPKTSLQIVVRAQWPAERSLKWQFARRDDAGETEPAEENTAQKPLSA